MDPVLGMIIMWPIQWAPQGWLACNGQLLNITQYQALFSLIGTAYGGNGTTTFALPDLRGRVPVGPPNQPSLPSPSSIVMGSATASTTATASVTLNIGAANLPAHTHPATFAGSSSTGSASVNVAIPALAAAAAATATNTPGPTAVLTTPGVATAKIYNTATNADTTLKSFAAAGTATVPTPNGTVTVGNNTGGGTPLTATASVPVTLSTYQPSAYVNFIIAVEGLYPIRP